MPCFSRTYRLITQEDFQSVFAQSKKFKHKYLIALACENQLSHPRLGLVISKRYFKRAVDRNLVRRIIRESFRSHKELMKGLDIIVLFRSECTPLDKQILRNDVDQLWVLLAKSLKTA